jgi:acyl-CoA synthetase (AMP-forming)/AMP-acid ligase II
MNLSERIRKVLSLQPEARAIEFKGAIYSWHYLEDIVKRLDQALTAAGLGPGSPIGVVLRNRPAHLGAVLGLLATQRCLVTINAFTSPEHIAGDLADLKLPALIADASDWAQEPIRAWARASGALGLALHQEANPTSASPSIEWLPDLASLGKGPYRAPLPGIAIEMLTSGTTGKPKRVPLSYETFDDALAEGASPEARRGELSVKSAPAIMYAPLVHVGGLFGLGLAVYEARPIALLEKFDLQEWLALARKYRPKFASLVPAIVRTIYEANVPKEDIASLRAIRSGTAPLDVATRRAFEERYGIPILVNYGATEFAGAVTRWPLDEYQRYRDTKYASVGRACPGFELRVVDRQSGEQLAPDEVGVLEIRSERLGRERGWTRTTDLASLDKDGFLYMHGRADDAIIRGGFKVLPDMVADTLRKHPAVKDAAVVALDDRRLGQVPAAAVETRPGATLSVAELDEFARKHLIAYQVPARYLILDELPRTSSMKVRLVELRELFAAEEARSAKA